MNHPGGEVRQRADTSGALLSLLAHDLREPLGPIELALSMIIEASSPDTAEIAGYAEANCRRMQRLIDAVLWAMRPPGALEREPSDLAQIASAAAEIAQVLGTACSVVAESCDVDVVPAAMRDAIASLLDCVPERVTAVLSVSRVGTRAMVSIAADGVAWDQALACEEPRDRRSAFVLGAAAVFAEHGGALEAHGGTVAGWIPVSA